MVDLAPLPIPSDLQTFTTWTKLWDVDVGFSGPLVHGIDEKNGIVTVSDGSNNFKMLNFSDGSAALTDVGVFGGGSKTASLQDIYIVTKVTAGGFRVYKNGTNLFSNSSFGGANRAISTTGKYIATAGGTRVQLWQGS
jgi:hypothetical protein